MESKIERLKKLEAAHLEQYEDVGNGLVECKNSGKETELDQLIALTQALASLRTAQALEQIVFILGEKEDA